MNYNPISLYLILARLHMSKEKLRRAARNVLDRLVPALRRVQKVE